MKSVKIILLLGLSLLCMFSIKNKYGGEVSIYLNEPYSLNYINDDFSSMIFYSFIYENFFFIKKNGETFSNIFKYYLYEPRQNRVELRLKENLSFSIGDPITTQSISYSINEFVKLETSESKELSKVLKGIRTNGQIVTLILNYEYKDIITLLSSPQLVLLSKKSGNFSGAFTPFKWKKGKNIILKANKYYSGGRSYIDSIKVVFDIKGEYPDVFLSTRTGMGGKFEKEKCGIYENSYLIFPDPKTRLNTKRALYSILKDFAREQSLKSLDVLTSDEESPVVIDIKKMSLRQAKRTILYSKVNMFFFPSLKEYQSNFNEYLESRKIGIKPFFLDSKMKRGNLNDENSKYIVLQKSFLKVTPLKAKIKRIISEMLFSRYNEQFMLKTKELDELQFLNKRELLMDKIAALISELVNKGILYPLFQKEYYLYYDKKLSGFKLDYYGKPLFSELRYSFKALKND